MSVHDRRNTHYVESCTVFNECDEVGIRVVSTSVIASLTRWARSLDEPLLFKGNDFSQSDIGCHPASAGLRGLLRDADQFVRRALNTQRWRSLGHDPISDWSRPIYVLGERPLWGDEMSTQ
jgi:hypothetical protein